VREPTSASRLEVGIEKGTPSAHSFINIYPHLNPSETESSSLFSFLLRPSLLPVLVHGLSPSSRPNSQACICSCKSFIRFVRGFASITAMGDPNRLFHLGFISPPILSWVLPLFFFCPPFFAFRDDASEVFVDSISVSCIFWIKTKYAHSYSL